MRKRCAGKAATAWLAISCMTLVCACGPGGGSSQCPDKDNDGYPDITCGGKDCNDNDKDINPGADESGHCSDSIDNNCDGKTDLEDAQCLGTCGAQGSRCCTTGDGCNSATLVCNSSDICVPCGAAANQPCCIREPKCANTLTCTNGTCVSNATCGTSGLACCSTGDKCLSSSLICNSGSICVSCGAAASQPCCATEPKCSNGLTCTNETCVASGSCGDLNQPCCASSACNQTIWMCNAGNTCVEDPSCGALFQICCDSYKCDKSDSSCQWDSYENKMMCKCTSGISCQGICCDAGAHCTGTGCSGT